MKNCKKMFSFMLATLLMLTILVGCNTDKKTEESSKDNTSESSKDNTSESSKDNTSESSKEEDLPVTDDFSNVDFKETGEYFVSEEPVTFTVLAAGRADYEVTQDALALKALQAHTNTKLEYQLLPPGDTTLEKFNLIFSSGDIPDIIDYNNINAMGKYALEGAFLPLQDLIDEHAPNMKKALDDPLADEILPFKQDAWQAVTAEDGNIYFAPIVSATNSIGPVYAIRTDWLDKLKLDIPETADDLYTVLKAFKDQDPNGNGEADEIPFIAGQGGGFGRVIQIVNAFDGHLDLYIDDDDIIKYGPVEEEYKNGVEFLRKLHDEGLLDPDYLTDTRDIWLDKVSNSRGGFMYVWSASGLVAANSVLIDGNTGGIISPIAPLKSTSGKQYKDTNHSGQLVVPRTAISRNVENKEAAIKLLDFCYSDLGSEIVAWGVEDLTFERKEDGTLTFTDMIKNNPKYDPETAKGVYGIKWYGLPYVNGWESDMDAMSEAAPWTVEAWMIYRENGLVEAPLPFFQFTNEELSEVNRIKSELNMIKEQYTNKIIIGEEDISYHEKMIDSLKLSNLEQFLEIYNTAYNRQK